MGGPGHQRVLQVHDRDEGLLQPGETGGFLQCPREGIVREYQMFFFNDVDGGDNDGGVGDIGEENDVIYEDNGETLLLIRAVFPDKGDTVIGGATQYYCCTTCWCITLEH